MSLDGENGPLRKAASRKNFEGQAAGNSTS